MLPFFRDLTSDLHRPRTVIVVDEAGTAPPRQYQLDPKRFLLASGGLTLAVAAVLTALIVLTPIRQIFLGPDPEVLRESARMTAMRAAALSDSLQMQREYLAVLRATLTGVTDTIIPLDEDLGDLDAEESVPSVELPARERTADWEHHEAPGLALTRLDALPGGAAGATEALLASLQFPAMPPVEGFFTRGYDAARAHFGIDIAVEEDTPVRAIGDGYVVFADWTNDGGFTIAVQHSDGYLSVYKHNNRLMKRIGDRVRNRESVALSGNTGEITTGPHLHFELWRNGLAQDPRLYLIGL